MEAQERVSKAGGGQGDSVVPSCRYVDDYSLLCLGAVNEKESESA